MVSVYRLGDVPLILQGAGTREAAGLTPDQVARLQTQGIPVDPSASAFAQPKSALSGFIVPAIAAFGLAMFLSRSGRR